MREYDQSSLDPVAAIIGRCTFLSLVFEAMLDASAATPGTVFVPAEWTGSITATSASVTSSVSYVHSGNRHLYFFAIGSLYFDLVHCGGSVARDGFVPVEKQRWRL